VSATYDTIGRTYTRTRRPDPRIASRIARAIGDSSRVVNVGAGAGGYEPTDRFVVGVDPSVTMLAQRPGGAGPAVRGVAEQLPFDDGAFGAAMATLTLHHWSDVERGLSELRRVAPRQVVLFFDPAWTPRYWLVADYQPDLDQIASERNAPDAQRIGAVLDVRAVEPVPVPADCTDGFGGAYWNRPELYLDPDAQAGISSFARLPALARDDLTRRLRADLESGAWDARHGHLRDLDELDLGYRLLIAGD
jgi:SAM-dependent methyltransferase